MYRVDVKNSGDFKFKVKSKEYEFDIDLKGGGITPPDTLLASLASCVGVYIRKYSEGAKLDIGSFTVTAEADLSTDRPVSFRSITVNIDLEASTIDDNRKKALLRFVENCPIHNTLHVNPDIKIKLV